MNLSEDLERLDRIKAANADVERKAGTDAIDVCRATAILSGLLRFPELKDRLANDLDMKPGDWDRMVATLTRLLTRGD